MHPDAGLFALLCWWNCRAIDCWEAGCRTRSLNAAGMVLALASFGYYLGTDSPIGLAAGMTAVGFLVLAHAGNLSLNWRRVAVDLCLLSPMMIHVR